MRQRRRLRSDNVLSLDGVLWQTDCGFLAGQVVTVRFSLLEPTPVLEHQGHCYALQPVDPVANGRRRRDPLPQAPPRPTVPFDPPKVQLDQWHRHHPDDEELF